MITDIEEEETETTEEEKQTSEEREEEAEVNGHTEEEETEEAETEELSEEEELEAAFNDFRKTTSEHKTTENTEHKTAAPKQNMSENDEFLISMFSGMFFSLCDGLHGFVLNFFSKHKLSTEDIELSEPQRKGLEIYFKTERVIKFLNKLSPELIGFVHMEWLYFQNMKLYNKKQDELILEQRKKKPVEKEEKPKRKKRRKKKKKPVTPNEG